MNTTDFINGISGAFHKLFRADAELFDLGTDGINEQTITFRLGLYLASTFQEHDVDCEYNRFWDGTKKCIRYGIVWMKPDVIVHVRQDDKANLLCVEAKKEKDWKDLKIIPTDVDTKLKALTDQKEDYRYSLGLAWRITPSLDPKKHDAVWFIHGKPKLVTSLVGFEATLKQELDKHSSPALQT
jgi:hypothetical protein